MVTYGTCFKVMSRQFAESIILMIYVLYFTGILFRGNRQKLVLQFFLVVFNFADGYVGLVPKRTESITVSGIQFISIGLQ